MAANVGLTAEGNPGVAQRPPLSRHRPGASVALSLTRPTPVGSRRDIPEQKIQKIVRRV
jgi:hypothetical protein